MMKEFLICTALTGMCFIPVTLIILNAQGRLDTLKSALSFLI